MLGKVTNRLTPFRSGCKPLKPACVVLWVTSTNFRRVSGKCKLSVDYDRLYEYACSGALGGKEEAGERGCRAGWAQVSGRREVGPKPTMFLGLGILREQVQGRPGVSPVIESCESGVQRGEFCDIFQARHSRFP